MRTETSAGRSAGQLCRASCLATVVVIAAACGGGGTPSRESETAGADSAASGAGRGGGGRGGGGGGADAASSAMLTLHETDCSAHLKQVPDSARQSYLIDCRRRALAVTQAASALRLAGEMMWSIPEYNDEQAFPTSANTYGPVALAFASPFLGTFKHDWQVEEQGARGMLAAVVVVVDNEGATLPGPYANLGLLGGINCIWLSLQGGKWTGNVSHTKKGSVCSDTATRTPLGVIARKHLLHPSEADYPPVTRFSEAALPNGALPTDTAGQPLIGVRCIDNWCELGPADAAGLPAFTVSTPIIGLKNRQERIKGWHDEQWLAVKVPGGHKPVIRAAFVPERDVNEKSANDFKGPAWQRVATVHFKDDPAATKYGTQMHLRKGDNYIEIRFFNNNWEAQVAYKTGGTSPLKFIYRHPHNDAGVPGTARFRWRDDDDGLWAPCGQACCRVEAEQ